MTKGLKTPFIQKGYRNGKKSTTRNIRKIGKHSELLKITEDPLAYAKEEVRKANEEEKKKKRKSHRSSTSVEEFPILLGLFRNQKP